MKKVKSKHKLKKVSNEKIQEKFDEIEAKEIAKSPSKMVIERGLISKLLETEDFNTYKDKQLKSYYFGEDTKPMISYIEKYYMKHGSLPTLRVFRKKFPDFELETYKSKEVGTKEPLTYWCDELRLKVTHNTLCDGVEKAGELLDETKTENALTLIKQLVLKVQGDYSESTAIDITKDKEDRLEVYKQRKLNKGMIGIPMGIDKLDMLLKGMQPKQLITLIARPGVGKTWFLILVACYCQLQGYRVLFFTTEMSEEQIEDRMEAVLIGMLYGEFNYGKFKSGSLSDTQEDIYMSFLERKEKLEPLIVESATGVGVSTVSAKITEYKPDVIFVDSAYLMEDDRSSTDQDWLRVAHITRDLKQIAKNMKLPIFINSQADSTTSKKTGPELDNIGFSSAIGQDSDVVMALFRDEEMIEDKEIKAKILKQREGVMGNVLLNWDFNTMNFKAIYSETPTGESLDKAETEHKNNYVEI